MHTFIFKEKQRYVLLSWLARRNEKSAKAKTLLIAKSKTKYREGVYPTTHRSLCLLSTH